ncbi:peptide ABC transporter substrate-binding protein [Clostridium peptidivorans]|uniref:peptide ABC transporter substrate-binding protein n=1 Tax=Clostridium peptidivorans TaxID=100174 RepID=UPI001FA8B4F9|nr:peptide ABC transporter substrate-binding protein [Clostridium peptidivorans]
MKRNKILALILTAALTLTTFVGCGGGDKKPAGGETKATVMNLELADIKTLDPGLASDVASFTAVNAAFEGLARTNNGKVEKAGAESWEVSADKKTYTFKLRDYNWSDGKPVTAKDFVYGWTRILDPNTKSTYIEFLSGVKNAKNFTAGKAKAEDLGLKAKDDKTFVVELERPIPYFEEMIAFPLLSPVREDVVKAQGDKYGTDPTKMVYCGPYTITAWQKGAKLTLKKNDKYYDKDVVKTNEVNLTVIKEMQTRYQMLMNKEIDAIQITGEYVEKLKNDVKSGKIAGLEQADPTAFYMIFNQTGKNKLLTNPKIRLAFSIAIDRETYVNKIYKRGFVSNGLVPTILKCGDVVYRDKIQEPLKEVIAQNKDPKALFIEGLKELGLDPDPAKHTVRYLPQDSSAFDKQSAEFFQNQWESKIGVNVQLDSAASFADYLKKTHDGNFEIAMSGWGADYNDPDSFIGIFKKDNGNNYGKYNNPKYEELYKKILNETDNAKRLELFAQAEKLLVNEDAGIAPIFYKDRRSFYQNNVKGLQYPAFGPHYELKWAYVEGK